MINDKLKKLRKEKHYTQAMVAEHLGVSTQTVSKWERGLLFPDIMILPRIAVLYNCSIDSIFDMESSWNIEHRNEFENKIIKNTVNWTLGINDNNCSWINNIPVKKAIIVTQEYHLYRALYIANELGLEVYGVPSDPRQYVGAMYREIREILARNKDFVKCLFKPKPTYLGESIPVSGSGDVTNDK